MFDFLEIHISKSLPVKESPNYDVKKLIYPFHFIPKNLVFYLINTRLRISAHQLYVENGKHCNPAIPRENTFCFHCKNIVKDEKQFFYI